jgi:hypothetical protein
LRTDTFDSRSIYLGLSIFNFNNKNESTHCIEFLRGLVLFED